MSDALASSNGTPAPSPSPSPSHAAGPAVTPALTERLISLDALRGFDMLWIVGGARLARGFAQYTADPDWFAAEWFPGLARTITQASKWFADQMHHPVWEGFTFYDLIFPMFLFISGITLPFSISRLRQRQTPWWKIHLKFFKRLVLLILLGIIYNGGFQDFSNLASIRYGSVLGFIGIGYYFAALIALHAHIRWQMVWLAVMMLGYWAAIEWIPVPGVGAGVITPEGSLATWVDQQIMPGRFHFKLYDPQGVLPCFAAIHTALLGAIFGFGLSRPQFSKWQKGLGLLGLGIALVVLGEAWGLVFPIIKNLWTGSFVFLTAGISLIMLSVFYFVIDVLGFKRWAFFFIVFGMNSITIYMLHRLINFGQPTDLLFDGLVHQLDPSMQHLVYFLCYLFVEFLVLWVMYRRKIFLKI